jgi:hypothetical protein
MMNFHSLYEERENFRERVMIFVQKMREIIGWEGGDSILAPGGSISNMYALMIARHKLFPQHKKYGMRAIKGQLIMYTSQHVSICHTFMD